MLDLSAIPRACSKEFPSSGAFKMSVKIRARKSSSPAHHILFTKLFLGDNGFEKRQRILVCFLRGLPPNQIQHCG